MTDDKIDHDARGRLEPLKIVKADGMLQANEIEPEMSAVPPIAHGRMPLFRERMSVAQRPLLPRRSFD